MGRQVAGGGPAPSATKLKLPKHLPGIDEVEKPPLCSAEESGDGLDTRMYYLQEYPQRIQMSQSQRPQFWTSPAGTNDVTANSTAAPAGSGSARGGVGASGTGERSLVSHLYTAGSSR